MTWKDLKIVTLQKIFSITGDSLVEDDTTNPYLKSMPQVANEALQLCTTAGRYIKKTACLAQGAEPPAGADAWNPLGNGVNRYDMKEVCPDFWSFDRQNIWLRAGTAYGKTYDYSIEGDRVLQLPAGMEGVWSVWYNAYPAEITRETPDSQVLDLHPEVAVILPLYMASQLYKDDDIAMSTVWRNEFEVAREILLANRYEANAGKDSWVDAKGWM